MYVCMYVCLIDVELIVPEEVADLADQEDEVKQKKPKLLS